MPKKILLLGGSRYYTKSIEAIQKHGYYVIVLDGNEKAPGLDVADEGLCIDFSDKEVVLKVAAEKKVNGIMPLNDIGVEIAAYVSSKLGLPGISTEVAFVATDKNAMRKKWMEKGIPCPCVELAVTEEDFLNAIKIIGLPCIFKPAHGLGGASRGVIVVNKESEIKNAIAFTQQFYDNKETLVETFINAELEHSAEVLVYNGVAYVIAISDKIKTPQPYRVDKNVLYPTVLMGERLEKLKETIVNSVLALGINNAAAHVEVATTPTGFILFELGARCGGGGTPEPIVSYTTGINLIIELAKILVGDIPNQLKPTANKAANYHFITPAPGKIKNISGISGITAMEGVLDFDFLKKAGDEINIVKTGLDRSGFIITVSDERNRALELGTQIENNIKIMYEPSL